MKIDNEPNPSEFFELLYNQGIGTMVADLYLCWAHYYDYNNNFEKAESVYQKGIGAHAEPFELLKQAHLQFGFSMSQRLLYRDESTKEKFRSTMDEQRQALTSLRAYRHRHVGSIRTGSAIKSVNPGRIGQSSSRTDRSSQSVQVFSDENRATNDQAGATALSPPRNVDQQTSVVQTLLSASKKQENLREPGPWSNVKVKISRPFVAETSNRKLPFDIMSDDDLIPYPEEEKKRFALGIQLPSGFISKNLAQTPFDMPAHRDDEHKKNSIPAYNKFMLFPNKSKSYSMEELHAYKWFSKKNITNNFTKVQDLVWGNGHSVPIRLPPHFQRSSLPQDAMQLPSFNPKEILEDGKKRFAFNIDMVYAKDEEYSLEEIMRERWLNGDLMGQRVNDMELTCAFDRRESIFSANANRRSMALGGRKSILPKREESLPRKSILRKSIAPPRLEIPQEEEEEEDQDVTLKSEMKLPSAEPIPSTSSTSREEVSILESTKMVINKEPVRFPVFEDEEKSPEQKLFKTPRIPPPKPRTSVGFALDDDGDGCTTQTFNFFLKSQSVSTPKVESKVAPLKLELQQRKLTFASTDEEFEPETEPQRMPFSRRSFDSDRQQYAEPELQRAILSAILETTEDTNTMSSAATTASSKSSSAEEFDYTKHTTHASTFHHQRTTIGNKTQGETANRSSMLQTNKSMKNSPQIESSPEKVPIIESSPEVNNEEIDEPPKPIQFSIFEDKAIAVHENNQSLFKVDNDSIFKPNEKSLATKNSFSQNVQIDFVAIPSIKSIPKAPTDRNESVAFNLIEERTETIVEALANRNQTIGFNLLEEQTETIPTARVENTLPFNLLEERTETMPIPQSMFGQSQMSNHSIFGKAFENEPTIDMSIFVPKMNESVTMPCYHLLEPKNGLGLEKDMSKLEVSSVQTANEKSIQIPEIPAKRDFSIFCDDQNVDKSIFPNPKRLSSGNSPKKNETPPAKAAVESSIKVTSHSFAKPEEPSKKNIDDEFYDLIQFSRFSSGASLKNASQVNRTQPSAAVKLETEEKKKTIDDEFYELTKTPPLRNTSVSKTALPKKSINVNTTSNIVSLKQSSKNESEDQVADSTISLLEPMKEISIHEHQKIESNFTFSDDNPNTQMFSLNLPSIKNSTLLEQPKIESKLKNTSCKKQFAIATTSNNKSKQISCFDDEYFKMTNAPIPATITKLKDQSPNSSPCLLDISGIDLNEEEMRLLQDMSIKKPIETKSFEGIMISEPKTIRPSEYQRMGNDSVDRKSFSKPQVSTSQSIVDESCIIIETIPTNNVNPFNTETKNNFLTDIDFVDYIAKLENVFIANRVQTVQPNSEMSFGDQTYSIYDKIAKGSFGLVFSGKCNKTNKSIALKQEDPPNLWELYISLEIQSRIDDKDIVSLKVCIWLKKSIK